MNLKAYLIMAAIISACTTNNNYSEDKNVASNASFIWENANVYFLLTDRFANGDTTNDFSYGRIKDGDTLRSYEGGDIRGVIQKLEEGYFEALGITALWMTPPIENVHGFVDEGTGKTYAYHGYWPRDWTNIDANLGSMDDYKELVEKAHQQGIRILMDVVLNHTGPETPLDNAWPNDWVRQGPNCDYHDFKSTVSCTLVSGLADVLTESNNDVALPPFLLEKWKNEGRLESELKELDAFFARTGYPRAPRFYIIKWLTDYVRELGIDGFRVDTVKHVEASVWVELFKEAVLALKEWKRNNQEAKMDDLPFYMVGEVYGFSIYSGSNYNFGDSSVNYFDKGFSALINFSFKDDINKNPEELFSQYSETLNGTLIGKSLLNYSGSHDDDKPFDAYRIKPFETATKLLLTPGASQIYYGAEIARILHVDGANGDANLRSNMNWQALEENATQHDYKIGEVLSHYCKLGKFRKAHPSVGAGVHQKIADSPYIFKRTLDRGNIHDKVVVVLDKTTEPIDVSAVFEDGTQLKDYYSETTANVENGQVNFDSGNAILLIGE